MSDCEIGNESVADLELGKQSFDVGRANKAAVAGGHTDANCNASKRVIRGKLVALVVATQQNFACRFPAPLTKAGFEVHAASPSNNNIRLSLANHTVWRLREFRLEQDIAAIVLKLRPDVIIPTDDVSATILMKLQQRADLSALISTSLGDPKGYGIATSKSAQMMLAKRLGVPMPSTDLLSSKADFDRLVAQRLPAVLKRDAAWGGYGVAVVRSRDEAEAAWTKIVARPGLLTTLSWCVHSRSVYPLLAWWNWSVTGLHYQDFAKGVPANRALYCRNGKVLAGFSVIAKETDKISGPATVVEITENPMMASSAAIIVAELGLSGIIGFDFIVDPETGEANFIEMNPRATPISTLPISENGGPDICGVIAGEFGSVTTAAPKPHNSTIALFPGEWMRDPASTFLTTAWHDVPWEEPAIVHACIQQVNDTERFEKFKNLIKYVIGYKEKV
jgi:hypothetical protein